MKTYGGVRVQLDTFLISALSFKPRPIYSRGKGTRYPLGRRVGGPQSRSGPLNKSGKLYTIEMYIF